MPTDGTPGAGDSGEVGDTPGADDATETVDALRADDTSVAGVEGPASAPDAERVRETLASLTDDEDGPTFEAPWQARAFALAVALTDREDCEWPDFQSRLVEHIDATDPERMSSDVEGVYYEEWLASLEEFLFERGLVSEETLDRRQADFEAGDRDESDPEFVVGDAVDRR